MRCILPRASGERRRRVAGPFGGGRAAIWRRPFQLDGANAYFATITLKFIVLTVLAFAPGIIGAAHLTDKHPVPNDRHAAAGSLGIAELPNPDGRFSRVHLLLDRI